MAPTPDQPDPFAPPTGEATPVSVVDHPVDDAEHEAWAPGDEDGHESGHEAAEGGDGKRHRLLGFARRHRILTAVAIILVPFLVLVGYSLVAALTKPGQESLDARVVQWARDNHLGFAVNWAEDKYYENNQPPSGGTPDQAIGPAGNAPSTSAAVAAGDKESTTTTKAGPPHLPPPTKMPTPAAEPIANEGEWFPAGQPVGGLPAVYTTKVRPNAEKTSLLVFMAWIDPKLASVEIFPGSEVPGGKWSVGNQIPADRCADAIMAGNGGFRFDQSRGGYWSEGNEKYKMRDGAATMVTFKDGTATVGMWGRDVGPADYPNIAVARQNLDLMVDNGQVVPDIDSKDWGALLKNVYFVWRSGWGVTKDGAIVYAGGPALQPRDIAQRLADAGAVRAMEGDINPEWVTANLYSVGPDGKCVGTKGLEGPEDKGGMRQSANRYLNLDTRDFVAVFRRTDIPNP
ncbi:MAG: hypothetical protein R2726_03410 [Acidimicrobiales bacterium]